MFASLFIGSTGILSFVATTVGVVHLSSFWIAVAIFALIFTGNAYLFEKIYNKGGSSTLHRGSVFTLIGQFAVFWLSLIYAAGVLGFVYLNINGYLYSVGFWVWTIVLGSVVVFSLLSLNVTSSLLIQSENGPALSTLQASIRDLNTTLARENLDEMRRVRDFLKFRIYRTAALDDDILRDLLHLVDECNRLAAGDSTDGALKAELGKLYDALQMNLGDAQS
ncbi:hypothetical protein N8739_10590 [Luminiphilus sp.]|nr:hypothetical protein [Luminiphilus sp.]